MKLRPKAAITGEPVFRVAQVPAFVASMLAVQAKVGDASPGSKAASPTARISPVRKVKLFNLGLREI